MSSPSIKVLVCYHKPSFLIKNDIFIPIHCGRGTSVKHNKDGIIHPEDQQWLQENCIGDDTGDNISRYNRIVCEVTGHYWTWKNYDKIGNPDYIGFMHYRRILVFPENAQGAPRTFIPFLTDDEYEKYLDPSDLKLGTYDMYVPKWLPVFKFKVSTCDYTWTKNPPEICKVKDQHPGAGAKANEEALKCIRENFPEYYQAALDYFEMSECFQWNMFIFRKEIFFEYCHFIFRILFDVHKKISDKYLCTADQRCMSYLAEHITGIFIYKKIMDSCRVKYLSMFFIKDTSLPNNIQSTTENAVTICCAADNNNSYMCEVLLQSVITHASKTRNYEIVVLWNTLSDVRQKKILLLSNGHPNILIRFYHVNRLVERRCFRTAEKSPYTSLFLLCVPEVFENYEKVLYLNHDVVTQTDIAELYDIDLGNNYVAACRDITTASKLNSGKEKVPYYSQTLGHRDPYTEHVSKDVVLFNVRAMKQSGLCNTMLKLVEENTFRHPAQDVLNKVCNGHVLMLDPLWNVCAPWIEECYIPAEDYWQWRGNLDRAKILSYRGTLSKPWNNTALEYASCWWKYARQTPIYEELLTINTKACIPRHTEGQDGLQKVRETLRLAQYQRKLQWTRLKFLLSWGARRQRYFMRKEQLKAKICEIKRFLEER